jgi:hypothetical protein
MGVHLSQAAYGPIGSLIGVCGSTGGVALTQRYSRHSQATTASHDLLPAVQVATQLLLAGVETVILRPGEKEHLIQDLDKFRTSR